MTRPSSDRPRPAALLRQPVATSLAPPQLTWEPAPPALLAQLKEVHAGGAHYAAAGLDGVISYCRICDPADGIDLFIKIVPRQLAATLQRAEAIASWLSSCGLMVSACLPGFPRSGSDGRVVFGYPFIPGTYLSGGSQQMLELGNALGQLHRELARYPEARTVASRRSVMRGRLRRQAVNLLADSSWGGGTLAAARRQLGDWLAIDAGLRRHPRQVIHNDLNIGNVLRDPLGQIWFLDFEEASWSHLPPYFDLARVIERFILARDDAPTESGTTAARQLLHAYAAAAGTEPPRSLFADALRWQLGFSWLRLGHLLREPTAENHPEVRKFLRLGEILKGSENWLEQL